MKRLFDTIFSFSAIVILAPLGLMLALLVRADSPGPVFYRGVRVGRFGKPFRIFKFRTMVADAETRGPSSTKDDDPRITRVGSWLRKHKLDELPQLANVLRGEMSFVGPRPQVPWAVELYTEEEKALLTVRPGITDYASLRFRHEGAILRGSIDPDRDYVERIHPEKVRLGLEYVRTRSMWTDLWIIWLTVAAMMGFGGRGDCETR